MFFENKKKTGDSQSVLTSLSELWCNYTKILLWPVAIAMVTTVKFSLTTCSKENSVEWEIAYRERPLTLHLTKFSRVIPTLGVVCSTIIGSSQKSYLQLQYKGWLRQDTVISLHKPKGGDGWHWRFGKSKICSSGMLCSRSSRTMLRLFAGWLCRRGPANW